MKKINIAIDGFSSCGKSTLARQLAKALNYIYIDTGAMYRAVAWYALKNNYVRPDGYMNKQAIIEMLPLLHISFKYNEHTGKQELYLNGENIEEQIRDMKVSEVVSEVSKIKEVRKKMVDLQRKIAESKGVVMDGRDIGTVVLPDAELKIFMTASPDVRAERRFKELITNGKEVTLEEVKENLMKRDKEDTTRKEAPLKQAEDAIVLDNTDLTPEEQLEYVLRLAQEKISEVNRSN
jgi:cytidylate kinase